MSPTWLGSFAYVAWHCHLRGLAVLPTWLGIVTYVAWPRSLANSLFYRRQEARLGLYEFFYEFPLRVSSTTARAHARSVPLPRGSRRRWRPPPAIWETASQTRRCAAGADPTGTTSATCAGPGPTGHRVHDVPGTLPSLTGPGRAVTLGCAADSMPPCWGRPRLAPLRPLPEPRAPDSASGCGLKTSKTSLGTGNRRHHKGRRDVRLLKVSTRVSSK